MEVVAKRFRSSAQPAMSRLMWKCRNSQTKITVVCGVRSASSLIAAASGTPDEVEIKLRLPDEDAHNRLAEALSSQLLATHQQENIFFDGANRELSSKKTIVRCRFYDVDKRALLTIKGQQVLKDGIGRGSEVEEDIDPKLARTFLSDPDRILDLDSQILQPLLKQNSISHIICLGGFRNQRNDFKWEGLKLELDKTMFSHGTLYEVEVESEEPELLKTKLEAFLRSKGISFSYSASTKFANFINKTLK